MICICGHKREDHRGWKGWISPRCEVCIKPFLNSYPKYQEETRDSWHEFKPDNLRYLESKIGESYK